MSFISIFLAVKIFIKIRLFLIIFFYDAHKRKLSFIIIKLNTNILDKRGTQYLSSELLRFAFLVLETFIFDSLTLRSSNLGNKDAFFKFLCPIWKANYKRYDMAQFAILKKNTLKRQLILISM